MLSFWLIFGWLLACGGGSTGGDAATDANTDAERSCDTIECGEAMRCVVEEGAPRCVPDCEDVECPAGRACDVASGEATCVASCDTLECASGLVCEIVSGIARCLEACDPACGPGQRCEAGECEDVSCEDLDCDDDEVCVPSSDGHGSVCRDNTCSDDVSCPEAQSCNGEICVDDVCMPGVRSCDGDVVRQCTPNGAETVARFTCASEADYTSECTEIDGVGGCSCRDDWDCPEHTECVVSRCEGTGREPTCFLPPFDFADVLPLEEAGFPWGGIQSDPDAAGRPFPRHAQAAITPIVANLDDDNGDGFVDELDFPEIVFLTFCAQSYFDDGVIRAVHGGGANAGADFFATCGDQVWHEGAPLDSVTCGCDDGDLEPSGGLAVGDLDGDGLPEIVAMGEGGDDIVILDRDGDLVSRYDGTTLGGNPAVTLANVDGQGFAEIVVGRDLFTLRRDDMGHLVVADHFAGSGDKGQNAQGPVSCVADILGDERAEIVAGATAYRWPAPPAGVTRRADCPPLAGLTGDDLAYCEGRLVAEWDDSQDGFCAIADVLGVNPATAPSIANPLDGEPEVVLVSNGHVYVYTADGTQRRDIDLEAGPDGGAPNIDDFDGDGFPEIGTALGTAYIVLDLQAPTAMCPAWDEVFLDSVDLGTGDLQGNDVRAVPALGCASDADCGDTTQFACNEAVGACVCLHNGWRRQTQDASSRVTGSSVFDFNGDGKAEVVYQDECHFRVYAGDDGSVYFRVPSQNPTRIDYPVVADVDNDGNAEIVVSASNARSEGCTDGDPTAYPNGIRVFGEPDDRWIAARRVWNQHAYSVTNVLEGGGIPDRAPASWRSYGGRVYNSYRSNPRPSGLIAPNLVVRGIQISSPTAACGEALTGAVDIAARIANEGDLRVGPGVVLGFYGSFEGGSTDVALLGEDGEPLRVLLTQSLEPGAETVITVRYEASFGESGDLPRSIRVVVDDDEAARECEEGDNSLSAPLEAGDPEADLAITSFTATGVCPRITFDLEITNRGSRAAADVVVRLYAGDPVTGAAVIAESVVAGPIAPGDSTTLEILVADFPARAVFVYAWVDPDDAVDECNDGDNLAATDMRVDCRNVLF